MHCVYRSSMHKSVFADRLQTSKKPSSSSSLHCHLEDQSLRPVLFFYQYLWKIAWESSIFESTRRDLLIGFRSDS